MKLSKESCVLIMTHYFRRADTGTAAHQNIRNHLLNKVRKIVYIEHPFPHSDDRYSYLTIYISGKANYKLRIPCFKKPQWLLYIFHFFYTNYFLIKARSIYDICFATENLSFISVLLFRLTGIIKRIVYYTIDYTPARFPNPVLNYIYHLIDRIACKYSDINWVVTKQQIEQRKKNGIKIKECAPFLVVPFGYRIKEIPVAPIKEVDRNHLIFAGSISERTGPQLAIKALPKIIKKYPKIHLTIIGSGEYGSTLRNLVKSLKLSSCVKFIKYIGDHRKLSKILTRASIGLAPYAPIPGSFSFFSDPTKIKVYLLCGLPVITTNIATIAGILAQQKAGIIIDYNEVDLYKAVDDLLSDKRKYEEYRRNALKLASNYDIDQILNSAIDKISQ